MRNKNLAQLCLAFVISIGVSAPVIAADPGSWSAPHIPVPIVDNVLNDARVTSVHCSSAGNCLAGGYYSNESGTQAFVVSQTNGTWGQYQLVVPLLSNQGNDAVVNSVSCSSAGNCVAGGYYTDLVLDEIAFVVSQTNGTWGQIETVIASNSNRSYVNSVSCSSAGNCIAGGYFFDSLGYSKGFVFSQTGGVWDSTRHEIPTAVNKSSRVNSVHCSSVGGCVAGGYFEDTSAVKAFVISQVNGVWDASPTDLSGTRSSILGEVSSVHCSSAGNCVAGGYYYDNNARIQAFVGSQTNGVWGEIQLAVPSSLNSDWAQVHSVNCSSAGNCVAGGFFHDSLNVQRGFVVSQTSGIWDQPVLAAPQSTNASDVSSVYCSSAGNCVAGGFYSNSPGDDQAFVVSQTNGVWGPATLAVPLNSNIGNSAYVDTVHCATDGACIAGGRYSDGTHLNHTENKFQAFLVGYTPNRTSAANTTSPVATTTPTLAATGANVEWLLGAGLLAVITGSGFLAISRRRRI